MAPFRESCKCGAATDRCSRRLLDLVVVVRSGLWDYAIGKGVFLCITHILYCMILY